MTVADKTIATATTTADASPGTSIRLEVQNLATAASLTSQAFTGGAASTVGTGTLTIAVGGNSDLHQHRFEQRHPLGDRFGDQLAPDNNPGVTASVISTSSRGRAWC